MVHDNSQCIKLFGVLVDMLYDQEFLKGSEGGEAKSQYKFFILNIVVQYRKKFLKFDMKKDKIDVFLGKYIQ